MNFNWKGGNPDGMLGGQDGAICWCESKRGVIFKAELWEDCPNQMIKLDVVIGGAREVRREISHTELSHSNFSSSQAWADSFLTQILEANTDWSLKKEVSV